MILQDPGVGMKDCQVWQPIEQVFLMDAAGSVSPDGGSAVEAWIDRHFATRLE